RHPSAPGRGRSRAVEVLALGAEVPAHRWRLHRGAVALRPARGPEFDGELRAPEHGGHLDVPGPGDRPDRAVVPAQRGQAHEAEGGAPSPHLGPELSTGGYASAAAPARAGAAAAGLGAAHVAPACTANEIVSF